jgi:hypothetical protein
MNDINKISTKKLKNHSLIHKNNLVKKKKQNNQKFIKKITDEI